MVDGSVVWHVGLCSVPEEDGTKGLGPPETTFQVFWMHILGVPVVAATCLPPVAEVHGSTPGGRVILARVL